MCFFTEARALQDPQRLYVQRNLRLVKFFCRNPKTKILQKPNIRKHVIYAVNDLKMRIYGRFWIILDIAFFSIEARALQDPQRLYVRRNLRLLNFFLQKSQNQNLAKTRYSKNRYYMPQIT